MAPVDGCVTQTSDKCSLIMHFTVFVKIFNCRQSFDNDKIEYDNILDLNLISLKVMFRENLFCINGINGMNECRAVVLDLRLFTVYVLD